MLQQMDDGYGDNLRERPLTFQETMLKIYSCPESEVQNDSNSPRRPPHLHDQQNVGLPARTG